MVCLRLEENIAHKKTQYNHQVQGLALFFADHGLEYTPHQQLGE